ncbi:site-specific DNA-methyltransferase [Qipengyuania sp. DGS5-3]|uniref:site-specific DNA-methyltransferase n=1 Tax=Qipengyuania sp. DGS5-3 TaxID=3349632 RepID=UPI0036D31DBF
MTQLAIIYRDPKSLTPDLRNARKHSEKQIEKIAKSIQSFGFNSPVLIDRHGSLIAGHGRVEAAKKLGLAKIPTVAIEHLSDHQKRAFMLADNRIAELSTWDEDILALELEDLTLADDPFEITDTGFEMGRIDTLIEDLHRPGAEENCDDDLIDPANVEAVARPGDLWLLGRHRLFVGNALEQESYRALLDGEQARMVFCDPPFNVPIQGHVSGLGKAQHGEFVMGSGEMSQAEFQSFLRATCERLIANSMDGSVHFICMDWRGLQTLLAAGEIYTELKNICCWVKSAGGMGSLYRSQHELVAVFKSGKGRHVNNVELGKHGRTRTNVWQLPGMNSFQKGRGRALAMHPTVKPVALVADAILDCSNRGDLVLDVFGGSGTTLIAAERTGRRAALMELDPQYADVSLRRFCDVTGIEPVNAATGQIVRRRASQGEAA